MLTIDASVFVASLRLTEVNYTQSRAFLAAVQQQSMPIYCPSLAITETVAAIARTTMDQALIQQAGHLVESLQMMNLVPLDVHMAQQVAQIAAVHRLRGADAIYVATAAEFGTTLITWDAEMLARGAAAASVQTPSDWLAVLLPPADEGP